MNRFHPSRNKKTSAASLLSQLSGIRDTIASEGENLFLRWKPSIKRAGVFPSALNLAHFIALRRMDLREVQSQLMLLGLSSLGHCESRVLSNLNAIIATLSQLVKDAPSSNHPSKTEFLRGHHRLNGEAQKLLGPSKTKRRVRIMATLPTEAAENPALLKDLLANGVDLVRINCAHGDREEWGAMIKNTKKAIRRTGIDCKIFMDLGGPKLRTDTVSSIAEKKSFVGDKILLAKKETDSLHFNGVRMTCTFPDVFKVLKVGAEIWIDDGTLGCKVEKILPEGALLRVDHAPTEGKRIKPAKGMNFPELDLPTTALTEKDLEDLDYLVDNADVIGLSFVQTAEDIQNLQHEIALRQKPGKALIPIVAKIETRKAVLNLPEIMIQGSGRGPFGVMIARGDLAVEIGYLRLAEIQEEILWLAEAADIPVIWATQVLEKMTREGVHSRAEMTDAVMGQRAECVMLNKGVHLAEAVTTLSEILVHTQANQHKKIQRLRALRSW